MAADSPDGELPETRELGVRYQLRQYDLIQPDDRPSQPGRLIFRTDQAVHRLVGSDGLGQKYIKSLTIAGHEPQTGVVETVIHESERFDLAVSPDESQVTDPDQSGIPARFVAGQRSVETHRWGGGYLEGIDKRTAYYWAFGFGRPAPAAGASSVRL